MSLLAQDTKKASGGCTDIISTDSKEIFSVFCAVTRQTKSPDEKHEKAKSLQKQTKDEIPLDIVGHHSTVVPKNSDKTVTVPSSFDVAVLTDAERKIVQKLRRERKQLQTKLV